MMFGRPSVRYGQTPEPETPYQKAGQAWDERLGSARVQAKNWRLAFFGALGLSFVLTGGLIWRSAQGTITPWVVEVDRLGEARAVVPATAGYKPTDPQIAWYIAHFIDEVRSVPADPVILRKNWLEAYNYVTDKGALALNDYARTNDPFAQLGKAQVSVDVASVIRASENSFRVEWVERRYVDNALSSTERWSAILTVTIQTPTDAEKLKKNPLGIYVHALNWSKELG
jgi:type IV secretion system protein VirB5